MLSPAFILFSLIWALAGTAQPHHEPTLPRDLRAKRNRLGGPKTLSHSLGVHLRCRPSRLVLANPPKLLENYSTAPQFRASRPSRTVPSTGRVGVRAGVPATGGKADTATDGGLRLRYVGKAEGLFPPRLSWGWEFRRRFSEPVHPRHRTRMPVGARTCTSARPPGGENKQKMGCNGARYI